MKQGKRKISKAMFDRVMKSFEGFTAIMLRDVVAANQRLINERDRLTGEVWALQRKLKIKPKKK